MKKFFQLAALLLVAVVTFSSCSKSKEDLYAPKDKLTAVMRGGDYSILIHYEGKNMSEIMFDGEVFNVIYDGKQISELNSVDGVYRMKFTYQDKKIVRIEFAENNVVNSFMTFTRDSKEKICKVLSYASASDIFDWKKRCENPLFKHVFDVETLNKAAENAPKSGGFDLTMEQEWKYEGDNIVETIARTETFGNVVTTTKTTYAYDNNNNPYYGMPYCIGSYASYSKNNVVKKNVSTSVGNLTVNTANSVYEYAYNNDKFPTMSDKKKEGSNDIEEHCEYTYIK